jgi:hypothetical protein
MFPLSLSWLMPADGNRDQSSLWIREPSIHIEDRRKNSNEDVRPRCVRHQAVAKNAMVGGRRDGIRRKGVTALSSETSTVRSVSCRRSWASFTGGPRRG